MYDILFYIADSIYLLELFCSLMYLNKSFK